jgi:archaeoflavoprotein AfpA
MVIKIAWGITGAGDYMAESLSVMKDLLKTGNYKITTLISSAGVTVVKMYALWRELQTVSSKIFIDHGPYAPVVGALQTGKFKVFIISPATANTVAKIVVGIADTLICNAVSQAQKGSIPIYIYPVDQKPGTITTVLPTGQKINITMRDIDIENARKLGMMKGITVLKHPREIVDILKKYEAVKSS